jgi:hypothetical protein
LTVQMSMDDIGEESETHEAIATDAGADEDSTIIETKNDITKPKLAKAVKDEQSKSVENCSASSSSSEKENNEQNKNPILKHNSRDKERLRVRFFCLLVPISRLR